MSVNGLGACIDQKSSLSHGVDQTADVCTDVRSVVPRSQRPDDLHERTLSVAQLEHLRRARIESYRTLGNKQQVLLAHLVVAQPRTGDEARTGHATGPGGWESPRS